ncbi:MAG: MATE family efflux transporter, partial [Armatimonadia bacterium]
MTKEPNTDNNNNNLGLRPNGYTITEDSEAIHTPVSGMVTPETTKRGGVDLTEGHLLKGIALLSWPIVTGAVLNWIMGGADTKMVSSLGPEAIAAVGQSQGIIFTIMAIIFAIGTGTQVLVARYTGARQPDRVAEVTRQTIIISIIVGILMVPLGLVLARPSLALLGVDGQVLHFGTAYMQAFFWGSIGLIINFMLPAALQGAGDTLTPLYTLMWMNVLHIASGYVMIFGVGPVPAMGVAGAAWAVVLSRGVAAIYMIWVVTSGRYAITVPLKHSWRIHWPIWGKMFYIGMPSSLQGLTRNVAYLMLAAILNHTVAGTFAISGHTVAGQWG